MTMISLYPVIAENCISLLARSLSSNLSVAEYIRRSTVLALMIWSTVQASAAIGQV